jgi:predicted GH43/DUF377 family glycosyl hydrolase
LENLEVSEFKKYLSPNENIWESARVGINTPPIKIEHEKYGDSLFMLYHGAQSSPKIYSMGYIIVDEKDPLKILERSKKPIITPELDYETGKSIYSPEVPNIIFGCGLIPVSENEMRFYYSGADKYPSFADIILMNGKIKDKIFQPKPY